MAVALRSDTVHERFRPRTAGMVARVIFAVLVAAVIFLIPTKVDLVWDDRIALAAIFGIIGLSVNVITGHAGQISLGHQAFVGIGAFMSAFLVTDMGLGFEVAILLAGVTGALMTLLLGLVALRIKGLYFALVTLAFGLMAEPAIFNWRAFTGGGSGALAPRPAAFESNQAYAYLCMLVLGLFLFLDWRLVKSKLGRAIVSVRNDERVAATLGVNVAATKLAAFMIGGFLAGVAGSLFAHFTTIVTAPDFTLQSGLIWVIMAVVGGLGSRAGVVAGSAFFALFPNIVTDLAGGSFFNAPLVGEVLVQTLAPLLGALLLLLTITLYPGGIGQQLAPIRRWLSGGVLVHSKHEAAQMAGFPLLLGIILTLGFGGGSILIRLLLGIVVGAVLAAIVVSLLRLYLKRVARATGHTGAAIVPSAALADEAAMKTLREEADLEAPQATAILGMPKIESEDEHGTRPRGATSSRKKPGAKR